MTRPDLAALAPALHPIRLTTGRVIEEPGDPITQVVFPDSGFVSVIASGRQDRRIEAGFIGFEGMTGLALVLGDDRSPHEAFVQVAGTGHCVSADDLRELMRTHPSMREVFLRYTLAFMIQAQSTVLANGRARIEERLARWLLMAHDRMERPELPLTHELLSIMLGVRRPGVTDALHRLEGYRAIRARRGVITILDRDQLTEIADASYGAAEAEYARLLGDPLRPSGQGGLGLRATPLPTRAAGVHGLVGAAGSGVGNGRDR
ncbi:MAG TPA: Crp/Fnr family transcriptional regulator [Caulobacteraceae bacterium]|nr:Crp/Fnr family transcriptional regulator [Caulobacteraceae bacterium]